MRCHYAKTVLCHETDEILIFFHFLTALLITIVMFGENESTLFNSDAASKILNERQVQFTKARFIAVIL